MFNGLLSLSTLVRPTAAPYTDANGNPATSAPDTPRFDHDAAGNYLGLLLKTERITLPVQMFYSMPYTLSATVLAPTHDGDAHVLFSTDAGLVIYYVNGVFLAELPNGHAGAAYADKSSYTAGEPAVINLVTTQDAGTTAFGIGHDINTGESAWNGHLKNMLFQAQELTTGLGISLASGDYMMLGFSSGALWDFSDGTDFTLSEAA